MTDVVVDYAAEKAASLARRAAIWKDADAQFTAWYQDVGTRVDTLTGGYAGAQKNVVLTTLPKCWCKKATLALGMCSAHYAQWWRKRNHVTLGLRNRIALCHPERKHHARGLCRSCYSATPEVRRGRRISKQRHEYKAWILSLPPVPRDRRAKNAWKCAHTNRPHYGYGICRPCCKRRSRLLSGEYKGPRIFRDPNEPLICGHKPDPKWPGFKGECSRCYRRNQMREWRRKHHGRRKRHRQPKLKTLIAVAV